MDEHFGAITRLWHKRYRQSSGDSSPLPPPEIGLLLRKSPHNKPRKENTSEKYYTPTHPLN